MPLTWRMRLPCALAVLRGGWLSLLLAVPAAALEHPFPRFPTTNGRDVVFTFAGDLYTVPVSGGTARRLTDGPGEEFGARFSPDGKTLAFSAQYEGSTELYAMPAEGGAAPVRLTYSAALARDDSTDRMGPNNLIMGWRNTVPEVVYRSRWHSWSVWTGELWAARADAVAMPARVPVPSGGWCAFSPDDSKMAYNRVFREFRTWKRYRGGQADDIWVLDFASGGLTNLSNHEAQDVFPMWAADGRVYFASDRTGRMNLFAVEAAGGEARQLTTFTDFDVKFPSMGGGYIVFEQGGRLLKFDLASGQASAIPVKLREDLAPLRPRWEPLHEQVTEVAPAPDGQRVVAVARGDVFTVPAKDGPTRPLTRSSGAHDRYAAWSPDGRWVAMVSDRSGEDEIWLHPADGAGAPVQLTTGGDTYLYPPQWAPDSRKLAWADRRFRLRWADVETKEVKDAHASKVFEVRDFAWSPDSAWLAFTEPRERGPAGVVLHELATGRNVPASDTWYGARNPGFSDDGKFLLFVSGRDYAPTFSEVEFNFAYVDYERVFLVPLAADTPDPLGPRSDEVGHKKPKRKAATPPAGDDDPAAQPAKPVPAVQVDAEGLMERAVALPTRPGRYFGPTVVGGRVYYLRENPGAAGDDDEDVPADSTLYGFDLEEREETAYGAFDRFEPTADGNMFLLHRQKDWFLVETPTEAAPKDLKPVSFAEVAAVVDRRAEWTQIFDEAWRQMRDFFYDANLHGVDWRLVRQRYRPLLAQIQSRGDLTVLLGEMIGELNAGHAYVGGGDRPKVDRVKLGLLGGAFAKDPATGFFRLESLLAGESWHEGRRNPLTAPGVGLKVGDLLVSVNGQPLAPEPNLYRLLIGQAGRQVALGVLPAGGTDAAAARTVTVVPVDDESGLAYETWVRGNLAKVEAATGGRVGYVHIPDMGEDGLNEFVRRFYPQLTKDALIVDVRYNGGGFVSPLIVERLRRARFGWEYYRGMERELPSPDPNEAFLGPMVCLTNEWSASDGDIFPLRFRAYGLGPLIGKRTWGGTVGIRGSLPFLDGGNLFKPEWGGYLDDGTWMAEGTGVTPDIVVDNDPAKEFAGEDQQLSRAIEEVLARLAANPPQRMPPPPRMLKPLP